MSESGFVHSSDVPSLRGTESPYAKVNHGDSALAGVTSIVHGWCPSASNYYVCRPTRSRP